MRAAASVFFNKENDVFALEAPFGVLSDAELYVGEVWFYPSRVVLYPRDIYAQHRGYFTRVQKVIGVPLWRRDNNQFSFRKGRERFGRCFHSRILARRPLHLLKKKCGKLGENHEQR
jgi:hypothetical protein